MSRSQLPQSDADRIAVATTTVAIAAILWLILAVAPNPHDVPFATAHAATAPHVDEGSNTTGPPPPDQRRRRELLLARGIFSRRCVFCRRVRQGCPRRPDQEGQRAGRTPKREI